MEGRETYEDRLGEAGVGVRYVGGDEIKDTEEEENVSKCGVGGLEYMREITLKRCPLTSSRMYPQSQY